MGVTRNTIPIPPGSVQGDILYHDGAKYTRLAAGTSGSFLKTQGTGANPTWGSLDSRLRVYSYSDENVPSGSAKLVWMDVISYQNNIDWDGTEYKATIQKAGYYLVMGTVAWAPTTAGYRYSLIIRKNGVNAGETYAQASNNTDHLSSFAFDIIPLVAGDYIQLYVYQATGSEQTIKGYEFGTFLVIHQIS